MKSAYRVCVIFLTALFLVPLGYLVFRSNILGIGPQARTSVAVLASPRFVEALADTLILMLGSGLLAVFLGFVAVQSLQLVKKPAARRFLALLYTLPFAIPAYVGALAWHQFAGPVGWIEQLGRAMGADLQGFRLVGLPASILVIALFSFPLAFLPFYAQLPFQNMALYESARTLGANRWRCFLAFTLPGLARPAVSGFLLVAFYALGDFGTVGVLRTVTLTRFLFLELGSSLDTHATAVFGLALAAVALALMAVDLMVQKSLRPVWSARQNPSASLAPQVRLPTAVAWALGLGAALIIFCALVLPLGVLGYWLCTGTRFWLGSNDVAENAWKFDPSAFGEAFLGSALASVGTAALATLVVFGVVFATHRLQEKRIYAGLRTAGFVSYSLPGIVVAIALVFLFSRLSVGIYQSFIPLLTAWFLRFAPETFQVNRDAVERVPLRFSESASTLGAGIVRRFLHVELPLLRSGLVSSFCLVFLACLKELPAAMVLLPAGAALLPLRVWAAASESLYASAAPYAIAMIALAVYPVILVLKRIEGGDEKRVCA